MILADIPKYLSVTQVFCTFCYSLSLEQSTNELIRISAELVNMFAMIEQSMNAVERILVYSELPPEHTESPITPPPSWPDKGEIQFKNVQMSYREGLPLVLKDLSFHIKAGEKVSWYQ